MRSSLFILFMCCFLLSWGQQKTIAGRVLDQGNKKPVAFASVNLKSPDNKLIAFKATDQYGNFTIQTDKLVTGCYLEINHLGFDKYQHTLGDKLQDLTVSLTQKKIVLEDIAVKSKPRAQQRGDTLTYDVASFAQGEDRNIGEVIKRMPGMEVSESGQIKYQGKSISNLYIDGDDLLDDRYAIGTRTIPHKMVKDIQVLNNHEHLKVLKNKRFTDEVAINLVIKEDAKLKLTAEAKIGFGLPGLQDNELNTILFNKRYKMLNVLNSNNTGKSLRNDLIGFNQESILAKMGTTPINNLLSLGTVGNPPIGEPYYLMNNTAAINANNLFNLRNKWQAKVNVQAMYDKSSRNFSGTTDFYLPNDTISYFEDQSSRVRDFMSAVRINLNKNVDKKFISNSFAFVYENQRGRAGLNSHLGSLAAQHTMRITGIDNKFEYVPQLKNGNIMQFYWNLNYGEKPQTLRLEPGVFSRLLNKGKDYQATMQDVRVPNFFTNLGTGYRFNKGIIKQYYQVGFSLESQKLNTEISLADGTGIVMPQVDSTVNHMDWLRAGYSVSGEYTWNRKRLETQLSLPVSYQDTRYSDAYYAVDEVQGRVRFNPNFRLKYRVAQADEVSFSYGFTNNFGNIQDVYRGMVIRSYRSISQNSVGINESSAHNLGLNYRLGRPLKLFFAQVGVSYSQTSRNAMISQQISGDISQSVLLPIDNKINNFQVNAGVDKFVFALASTVKLKSSWSYIDYNQVFNGDLLPFQNIVFTLQPEAEAKLWKDIKLSYNGQFRWSTAKQKDQPDLNNRVFSLTQQVGLPLNLIKSGFLRISGRHLYTKQPFQEKINYFFLDAFARYRHVKSKMDFELSMNNLANIKTFSTYSLSANQQNYNHYELRGRNLLMRVVFNF